MRFASALLTTAMLSTGAASTAYAGVSQEEADRLGADLTPLGATKAGNDDGSIPAWSGGLREPPSNYEGRDEGGRLVDPFPADEPLYTITADNLDEHRDMLSDGHLAMFETFPDSYTMPVYETRRPAAAPEYIYEATRENATRAKLDSSGEALIDAIQGIPFPIPENGHHVIWNHKVRYRGQGGRRWNNQFAVTTGGDFNAVELKEDFLFNYNLRDATIENLDNVLIYFLQIVEDPARLAGQILLVHETMDQVTEPRRAWQYNPGQRRLRRAPNVGYDNPGTAADGLRTNDQFDMYNGAMDRYTWKLVGKKEMIIPYNSYRVHSDDLDYDDIIKEGHVDQSLTRYERHRVWVVESDLKDGTSHIYKRRTFYVDEDFWQIAMIDAYDNRDQLWRFQEAHTMTAYHPTDPGVQSSMETIYDLQNGRYLVLALNNEHDETTYNTIWDIDHFQPGNVQRQVKR